MGLIKPVQQDEALLEDIAAASGNPLQFHLWWLGQSGFLIKWQRHHLLFDPYLSDSLTQKYEGTDKPHVRMTERVIDPSRLDMLDVVTSSHNHTDHLDRDTLAPLSKANPDLQLVIPEANIEFAQERLGETAPAMLGLDDGITLEAGVFQLTGVAAAHNTVERDEKGRCKFLGFILKFGAFCVYHSGDTLWHRDLVPSIAPHRPDVALVPINGNKPERRVAGNLDGLEAAAVAKGCGARLAIPHHFEMFEFNTASPEEFVTYCERLGQDYRVLRAGERITLS